LDFGLQKYQDFKGYLDEYFRGEISKDEILEILDILRERYERQHTDLLEWLERDADFYRENATWIETLRDAANRFEEARDSIEETILEDGDDIEDALETFKEGNRLLLEVSFELEETVERANIRGYTL
jgi:DNA replication initiation complex subunit (GINS family)